MNPYFPFHSLGFKCNPFRTLQDDEWGEIAILSPALVAVAQQAMCLQILGAKGEGKTTALLGLRYHFLRAGRRVAYEYIPEGQTYFKTKLTEFEVFLLDEAQRVERKHLSRLKNLTNLKMIFATHQDLKPLFPSMETVQVESSRTHLRRVVDARLTYFALAAKPICQVTDEALDDLYERFGSDLRATEKFLYEVFQRKKEKGDITRRDLQNET